MCDSTPNKLSILIGFWLTCLPFISSSQVGSMAITVASNQINQSYLPDDIGDLWLWLDGDDSTTVFKDAGVNLATYGERVQQWNDKSGNNHNVTQTDNNSKGAYANGAFNGRDAIDFDNNDWMSHILSANYSGSQTLFIVLKSQVSSPAKFDSYYSSHNTPSSLGSYQIDYDDAAPGFFQLRTNNSGSITNFPFANFVPNQIKLFSIEYDQLLSQIKTFDNGNLITTGTQNYLFSSQIRINRNRNSSRSHDGQIAEVIIYNKVLSNCENYKVISYLNSKYNSSFAFKSTPGGLDCDGNRIWLRANVGTSTTTNGAAISQWDDVSTSSEFLMQPLAASQPIYRDNTANLINYNPIVDFSNGTKSLINTSIFSSPNSELSVFLVSKEHSRTNNQAASFSSTASTSVYEISNPNSAGNLVWDVGGTTAPNRLSAPIGLSVGTPFISTFTNSLSNNQQEIKLNGDIVAIDATGHSVNGIDITALGTNCDAAISEFIVFDRFLPNIEVDIIESYLGIKYGITLKHDYLRTDEVRTYDVSNGYNNAIFGVAYDKPTGLQITKSHSEDPANSGLTLELTTNISSGGYLIIGQDNGSLGTTTVAGEANALVRKFYAEQTGGVGTVNLEVDLAVISRNTASTKENVKIIIANNPLFINSYIIESSSVSGGIAKFEGIPLNDKYFTFSAP